MSFIGEKQIRDKIEKVNLNQELVSKGIQLVLIEDTFRDYQAHILIEKDNLSLGKAIVYYSSRKNSFRIRFLKGLDKEIESIVESIFLDIPQTKGLTAYVDGSYIGGITGYGVVLLEGNMPLIELKGTVDNKEASYHQVGGELQAALEAMKWAKNNGYKDLTICYDYEGVKKFATKEWQGENSLTLSYQKEVEELGISLKWVKIAAHTGVKWNERADELAKEAASSLSHTKAAEGLPQAESLALSFTEVLSQNGFSVENKGVINGQFVRLCVSKETKVFFDLYDTKKRPLIPYIHGGAKDEQKLIDELFRKHKVKKNIG